jgi:hypothetical protein
MRASRVLQEKAKEQPECRTLAGIAQQPEVCGVFDTAGRRWAMPAVTPLTQAAVVRRDGGCGCRGTNGTIPSRSGLVFGFSNYSQPALSS